jgi:hypothetical protein
MTAHCLKRKRFFSKVLEWLKAPLADAPALQ